MFKRWIAVSAELSAEQRSARARSLLRAFVPAVPAVAADQASTPAAPNDQAGGGASDTSEMQRRAAELIAIINTLMPSTASSVSDSDQDDGRHSLDNLYAADVAGAAPAGQRQAQQRDNAEPRAKLQTITASVKRFRLNKSMRLIPPARPCRPSPLREATSGPRFSLTSPSNKPTAEAKGRAWRLRVVRGETEPVGGMSNDVATHVDGCALAEDHAVAIWFSPSGDVGETVETEPEGRSPKDIATSGRSLAADLWRRPDNDRTLRSPFPESVGAA
jgi:hypothetical protein